MENCCGKIIFMIALKLIYGVSKMILIQQSEELSLKQNLV